MGTRAIAAVAASIVMIRLNTWTRWIHGARTCVADGTPNPMEVRHSAELMGFHDRNEALRRGVRAGAKKSVGVNAATDDNRSSTGGDARRTLVRIVGFGSPDRGGTQRPEVRMAGITRSRFEHATDIRPFVDDRGSLAMIDMDGVTVGRADLESGWRWSDHVKPIAGADGCQAVHAGYILSEHLTARRDAQRGELRSRWPPERRTRHDAWVVGASPT